MAKIKVPTVNDLVRLTTEQIEALTQLPSSIVLLNQTLASFAQTVGRLDKLVKRLDRLTEPLEEPLTALAPRLQALVPLLDEELMSSLPEVLDSVRRNAVPALEVFGQTQAQVASIAASVDRLMHLMDDTLLRLQDLPGVGLVNRLRGAPVERDRELAAAARPRGRARKAAPPAAPDTTPPDPGTAPAEPAAPPVSRPVGSDPRLPRPSTDIEESRSWRG
jgi:ABC-type transporter Mla subunit MlaD